MRRGTLMCVVLLSVLLISVSGFAADDVSSTRGGLKHAVELYIDAQTRGDISGLPLAAGVSYIENMEALDIKSGIINTPMKIYLHAVL